MCLSVKKKNASELTIKNVIFNINSLDVDCPLNIPKFYTKTWGDCHRVRLACSGDVKL